MKPLLIEDKRREVWNDCLNEIKELLKDRKDVMEIKRLLKLPSDMIIIDSFIDYPQMVVTKGDRK